MAGRLLGLCVAWVLIAASGDVLAAERKTQLVAVLPFDNSKANMDVNSRALLEETVRNVAGDVLSSLGYTVLNGDNTLAVLSGNGIDPTKACEASCTLEAARELKAEPSQCVVVEDSVNGVVAGRAAGMTVWGFVGGGHCSDASGAELKAAGATRIIENWAEFNSAWSSDHPIIKEALAT